MIRGTIPYMQIKPCTKTKDGNHQWRATKRKHGNPNRRSIVCALCNLPAQESHTGKIFTTAHEAADSKKVAGSYRTWQRRVDEIKRAGYSGIQEYIDFSTVKPKK